MSRNFSMYNSGGHENVLPHVTSRQQQLDNVVGLRKVYPDWKLVVFQWTATVAEDAKKGEVLYTSRAERGPYGEFNPRQEMVGRFLWRRRKGDGVW